ncbi:MAG: acyltransferase family protein [Acidimicrobiales bacterium]
MAEPVEPPAPAPAASPVGWMPGIEALRGLAAAAVVVFHMWALTSLPHFQGYEVVLGLGVWAVDLFFLLSGFLLVQTFWEQPRTQTLGQYYVRRAFRIVPAYYVCVGVLFLFFANREVLFSGIGLKQVAANLTFTQWFSPTTASSLNVSGVFWTLSIEVVLYALLPLLAWAIARRPLILGGLLFAVGFAYRLYVTIDPQWLQDKVFGAVPDMHEDLKRLFLLRQFAGVLPLFMVGMLLRWWLHYRPGARPATAAPRTSVLVLLVLLIPSIVMLTPGQKAVDFHNAALFVVFDVAIVVLLSPALVYAARTVVGRLSPLMKVLVWLGKRSYGIYLWHFPAILIALDRGPLERGPTMTNVWARLAAATAATLVLGALSYRWVERPSRAAGRRVAAALA